MNTASSRSRVLLVEDDRDFGASMVEMISRLGFDVKHARTLEAARGFVEDWSPTVIVADLSLPDGDGLELRVHEGVPPETPIVVVTGNATSRAAKRALEIGATDYLTKPVDAMRLKSVLYGIQQAQPLRERLGQLERELRGAGRFGEMIGRSGEMQRVYEYISRVASTRVPVLITGESGVGKELVAETIHARSGRSSGPFLAVNCGAVPETLIESTLFGHKKGSFTGAQESTRGVFEQASGGTLFLDEIGEMPPHLQVRLLRVLETNQVRRVGDSQVIDVDVRLVAATNRDPEKAVATGTLREDLFFRLSVFRIQVPPLRARGEDVLLLADHFLDALNKEQGASKHFEAAARQKLLAAPWPGNVRQLRNLVQRAWILSEDVLRAVDVELHEQGEGARPHAHAEEGARRAAQDDGEEAPTAGIETSRDGRFLRIPVGCTIADAERKLIEATLENCGGNKRQAARTLGVSVKTVYNRLSAYDEADAREPDAREPDAREPDARDLEASDSAAS
jgi:DNA-binding NtrC family response regulator